MQGFYCDICDGIIVRESKAHDPIPTHHYLDGDIHRLTYMGWWHPDFKVCEVMGTIRHQIETFGLSGALEQVLFEGETQ